MVRLWLIALAVLVLLCGTGRAVAAAGDTILVTRATGTPGAKAVEPCGASMASLAPSSSSDGRYIAFASSATNLSPDDDDNHEFIDIRRGTLCTLDEQDVFVRDILMGTTTLVSRETGLSGDHPEGIDAGLSAEPSISADGRYVAFEGDGLGPGDDQDFSSDIYVRDLVAGTTERVDLDSDGDEANSASIRPAISADGRYVVFESTATNLAGDTNSDSTIFRRDLMTDTTIVVDRVTGPGGVKANGSSDTPTVSANGNRIAFHSEATNLPGSTPENVYVRDVTGETTTLVSVNAAQTLRQGESPSISADGNHVAFLSIFHLAGVSTPATFDLYTRNLQTNANTLVNRADGTTGGIANGNSALAHSPHSSISDDGRFVAFRSVATNLDPGDTDADPDIYLRDLLTGSTALISRSGTAAAPCGTKGGEASDEPAISGNGAAVAFSSDASLHPDDVDFITDAYLRQASASPGMAPLCSVVGGTDGGGGMDDGGGGGGPSTGQSATPTCLGRTATIVGTAGPDRLKGTKRADVIVALGGKDRIKAGKGKDRVCAGPGKDKAVGGAGKDSLSGQKGKDRLAGGAGNDKLVGGKGRDTLLGGKGKDKLKGGAGRDVQRQ